MKAVSRTNGHPSAKPTKIHLSKDGKRTLCGCRVGLLWSEVEGSADCGKCTRMERERR